MIRPERFLSEDRTHTIKKEYFVPFGMVKRICMGESLAKLELFIFTVLLLRDVKFSVPKGHKKLDAKDDHAGITKCPNPFHVRIERRS